LGLFQSNYNRPGPGISKNQPKKKSFFLFFDIFFRKFWDLMKLNLIFSIPVLISAALIFVLNSATSLSILLVFPLLLISPFTAGLTLVTRNYAREEHAFIFSDFIGAVKGNWVAFLINGIVCYAVYVIFSVSITYYASQTKSNGLFLIPMVVCIAISVLFIFSQYYVPVMIITFDLKLRQIYKNAIIFSIIGLWRNLLLTVILAFLLLCLTIMVQLMPLTFLLAILLVILILFSFCMFLINFIVYPLVDKTMIEPYREKDEASDRESAFHDNIK